MELCEIMWWYERGCVWEKTPYLGIEKSLRDTEREREREEKEEGYYIISTFFPPPFK